MCLKVCPATALSAESQKVVIGGRSYDVAKLEAYRCMWGSVGLTAGSLARNPAPVPDNVGPREILTALSKLDHFSKHEMGVVFRGDYCGKCMMECPVGSSQAVDDIVSQVKAAAK